MVAEQHQRGAVLPGVVHVRGGVGQSHAAVHAKANLSGGFGVTVGHGDRLAFVDGLDKLNLGPGDQGVAQRAEAGTVGDEHVACARLDDLLGQQIGSRAGHRAGERLSRFGSGNKRRDRLQGRLGG